MSTSQYAYWLIWLRETTSLHRNCGQSLNPLQSLTRVLDDAHVETYKLVGEIDLRLSIVYPADYR